MIAAWGFLLGIAVAVALGELIDLWRRRLGAARCVICGEVFEDPEDFLNHRCRVPRPAA